MPAQGRCASFLLLGNCLTYLNHCLVPGVVSWQYLLGFISSGLTVIGVADTKTEMHIFEKRFHEFARQFFK